MKEIHWVVIKTALDRTCAILLENNLETKADLIILELAYHVMKEISPFTPHSEEVLEDPATPDHHTLGPPHKEPGKCPPDPPQTSQDSLP